MPVHVSWGNKHSKNKYSIKDKKRSNASLKLDSIIIEAFSYSTADICISYDKFNKRGNEKESWTNEKSFIELLILVIVIFF